MELGKFDVITLQRMSNVNVIQEFSLTINKTYVDTSKDKLVPERAPNFMFLLYGCYVVLIFLTGLIQNAVTLFVFLREKRLWKVHNYFIVGLAISDIGMCIFGNWMIIVSAFSQAWMFQRAGKAIK